MKVDKKTRLEVWAKYDFKCGYCGKDLEYKEMQVDHIHPQCSVHFTKDHKANFEKIHSFENLMPSCRSCNHYKRGDDLEQFRHKMKTLHNRIERDYINKVGIIYGIVKIKPFKGEFFFETFRNDYGKKITDKRQLILLLKDFESNLDDCFQDDLLSSFGIYYKKYHSKSGIAKNTPKSMILDTYDYNDIKFKIFNRLPKKQSPDTSLIKMSDKKLAQFLLGRLISLLQRHPKKRYLPNYITDEEIAIAMVDENMPYEVSVYNGKELKISYSLCYSDVKNAFTEANVEIYDNKKRKTEGWTSKDNFVELEQFGASNMLKF
jgi:hypothetical protein